MDARTVNAESAATRERRAVEDLIDDMLTDSFPASDPPTWDSAARRMRCIDSEG